MGGCLLRRKNAHEEKQDMEKTKNRISKSIRERKEMMGEKEFNSLNGGEMMKRKV